MGDPVSAMAALGLAANIGQMIEHSLRIVSKSKELRESLDGSLPESRHKTIVTESLLSASCTLSGFLGSCTAADKALSPEDEHLRDISKACSAIASDLLDELGRLRLILGLSMSRGIFLDKRSKLSGGRANWIFWLTLWKCIATS